MLLDTNFVISNHLVVPLKARYSGIVLFLCVSRPQSSSNGSDTCSTNHSVCAGSEFVA